MTTPDNRRARFSSIEGMEREDLPLAYEVWVEDHFAAPWATRETMKLAQHLVRYMASPKAYGVSLGELESLVQLNPDEVRKTLAVMQSFGAVDSFTMDRLVGINVMICLTYHQRLRVLEAKRRFAGVALGKRPWVKAAEATPAAPKADPAPQQKLDPAA